MVIFQLLLILLLWLGRSADGGALEWSGPVGVGVGSAIFLGVYAILILGLRLWSMGLARRLDAGSSHRGLRRFDRVCEWAKWFIPLWLAMGIYGGLRWGDAVSALMPFMHHRPFRFTQLPPLILGIAPSMLAWIGLWWAEYPGERASRENALALDIEDGLPVHSPPSFGTIFKNNFRMQILFLLAPILVILLAHDVVAAVASLAGVRHVEDLATLVMPLAATVIFILAPLILVRAIPTEPLPDSPIRRRLENLCRRTKIRCRDILIWKTDSSVGNAMVLGLFRQVRYILISDLLLERMTDEQVEAVFAHEMGHVAHRHLWWLVAYMIVLAGVLAGPLTWLQDLASRGLSQKWLSANSTDSLGNLVNIGILVAIFFSTFAAFSKRLERQADVFAARMMELSGAPRGPEFLQPRLTQTFVGEYGAGITASALQQVAAINRIPLRRGDWRHGSIQSRMNYLLNLSGDPSRTGRFDKTMGRLFVVVIVALLAMGTWGAVLIMH